MGSLTFGELRSLAGNAVHSMIAGALTTWVLASFLPLKDTQVRFDTVGNAVFMELERELESAALESQTASGAAAASITEVPLPQPALKHSRR